jgi:hypothetical protein
MIVYASAITDPELYRRCAEAGFNRVRESDPECELIAFASAGSIFRNYNLIIDQVRDRDDLEALVLIHQDAEIVDPEFNAKIRAALSDPEVAIVGCAGALDVRSIAWWEGSVTWASFAHRYEEYGGGEVPGFSWRNDDLPPYARTGPVDSIDGFVMVLSPWALRELRFDETLGALHGYDLDICMQARTAGKKVVIADLKVVHHHSLKLIGDLEGWIQAHIAVGQKWESELAGVAADDREWKQRARRAEAEASAARLLGGLSDILHQAQSKELEEIKTSRSWRLMSPARRLGRLLRRG